MNVKSKFSEEIAVGLVNAIILELFNNPKVYPFFYLNLSNLGEWYADRERTENPIKNMNKPSLFMSFIFDSYIEILKFNNEEYEIFIYPNIFGGKNNKLGVIRIKKSNDIYVDFCYKNADYTCGPLIDFEENFTFEKINQLLNNFPDEISLFCIELDKEKLSWGNRFFREDADNNVRKYNLLNEDLFGIYSENEYNVYYSYFPSLKKSQRQRTNNLFQTLRQSLIEKNDVYEYNFHYSPLLYKNQKYYFKNQELQLKEKTMSRLSELLGLEDDDFVEIYMNIHFPKTSLLVKHYKEKGKINEEI